MATGLMSGKRGLIMGVANDKSIAWGIAQACHDAGAALAFTYQGEALGKRVQPLAASVGSDIVLPCDVTDEASLDAVFAALAERWRTLDFLVHAIGFSDKNELRGSYTANTTAGELHPDHADLGLFLHRRRPARGEDDAGRRRAAHAHLLRRREGDAALQRHGRRQGGAGGVGQVHGHGPRPARHPGQRALRRADQDAGRLGHRRLPLHHEVERAERAPAPQRHPGRRGQVRALPPLRSLLRRHRREPPRGRRLPRGRA